VLLLAARPRRPPRPVVELVLLAAPLVLLALGVRPRRPRPVVLAPELAGVLVAAAARRPRPRVPVAADLVDVVAAREPPEDELDPDVLVRPRSAAPWRCATRYTDDSPMPKRLLISETGVSVSA
jgi:hypothetical protein